MLYAEYSIHGNAKGAILNYKRPQVLVISRDKLMGGRIFDLLQEDCRLTVCESFADGKEEASIEAQRDLVIIDVISMGRGSFDFCRQMKLDERWAKMQVMFILSGGVEEQEVAYMAGGDDFISAPFPSACLINRVLSRIQYKAGADILGSFPSIDLQTGLPANV